MKQFLVLASLSLLSLPAIGQISYTDANNVYYENFNNPAGWGSSHSTIAWENNVTVAGWSAGFLQYSSSTFTYVPVTTLRQSTGVISPAGTSLFMFRAATDYTEGALGSVAFDTYATGANNGGIFYGVQIVNNTGAAITSFNFGYAGEQWNVNGNANVHSLLVSYSTTATGLYGTGSWTAVPEATFNSPITSGSYYGSGNTQRTEISGITITDVNIAAGESVWIRWFDVNNSNNDHGLAVDDFYFTVSGTPVPEPSSVAALFGVAALGFAAMRRSGRRA